MWITRDYEGILDLHFSKPIKMEYHWESDERRKRLNDYEFPMFKNLTWEDEPVPIDKITFTENYMEDIVIRPNTLNEVVEILKAIKEGGNLQIRSLDDQSGTWTDLYYTSDYIPRFTTEQYRIKPSMKYRPYESKEEFIYDFNEHGPWIMLDGENWAFTPDYCDDKSLAINKETLIIGDKGVLYYRDLLDNGYTWQDGKVCGIFVLDSKEQ